jgi:hypothetical protein
MMILSFFGVFLLASTCRAGYLLSNNNIFDHWGNVDNTTDFFCPYPTDLTRMYSDSTFVCARIYNDWYCGGQYVTIEDDTAVSYFPYSGHADSAVVRPGCKLELYTGINFGGIKRTYEEDFVEKVSNNVYDPNANSIRCRCAYGYPNCDPEDYFKPIIICDARTSSDPYKCAFKYTIGAELGESLTRGIEMSTSMEKEILDGLGFLFSSVIGMSDTTGYDWNGVTRDVQVGSTTIQGEVDVPPGAYLTVEQVAGECSDSNIYVPFLRVFTYEAEDGSARARGAGVGGKETVKEGRSLTETVPGSFHVRLREILGIRCLKDHYRSIHCE